MARWKVSDDPSPSWFDLRLQSGRRKRPTQAASGVRGCDMANTTHKWGGGHVGYVVPFLFGFEE